MQLDRSFRRGDDELAPNGLACPSPIAVGQGVYKGSLRKKRSVGFDSRRDLSEVSDKELLTIIDSLTTRLEYVEGSQSSSREAKFDTQENAGELLVLRWALTDPLKVNEGGIVRFQCRVR